MNTNKIQRVRIRHAIRAARSAAPKIEWLEARQLLSTYTVNSLSDVPNPGAGVLTLRQAVAAANTHAGADTINFAASLFPGSTLQTLTLQQGEIDFTDTSGATTLTGPGATKLAINGNNATRIFGVSAGVTVNLSGTTLTGGNAKTMSADGNYRGGAVENHGTLTINSSTITGNSAGGPAINNGYGPYPFTTKGGAIYSAGPLTVQSSTFSSNSAKADSYGANASGGAIYCTAALTIAASTLSGNSVEAGQGHGRQNTASGGAVFVTGALTIDSSALSGNSATGLDGSGSGEGGAITAGSTTTISATTISGNHAGSGSDLYGDAVAFGGGIKCSGNLTITSSKLTGNSVSAGYTEPNNKPAAGGGIFCGGALTLVNSEVSGNWVSGSPGGGGGNYARGGGMFVGGALSISGSSITNNGVTGSSSGDSGSGDSGCGGGIFAGGAAQISTTTITGNTAVGGNSTQSPWAYGYSGGSGGDGLGGGIFAGGPLSLSNSTISQNSAGGGNGGNSSSDRLPGGPGGNGIGGGVFANSTVTLTDSTVSGNTVAGGGGGSGKKINQQGYYYDAQADPGKGIAPNISASGVSVEIQAKTSGPYTVNAGGTLQLDASKSVAPTGSVYSWDVNGDKVYGDATGISPKLTWAQLTALKLHDGVFAASVRITTGSVTAIATTTLTVHAAATVAQVSGTVFNDLNANGNPESNEPKVAGRTVYLDGNNNAKLDVGETKMLTDVNGRFTFTNLQPGTYRIREVLPAGWRQTAPNGNTAARVVTLVGGQNVTVMQIGATQAAVISGKFYNDLNSNGVFDSIEKGLPYWQVYVDKNNNGIWDKGEYIVTADSKGNYTMVLKPGTYRLREVRQTGWTRTQPAGAWPGGYYDVTVAAGQLVSGRNFGNHL